MTVDQLLTIYMPARRRLLEARVPLDGWVVSLSLEDADDLNLEVKEGIDGAYVYGALWQIDASLSAGMIRLDTRTESITLFHA